MKPEDLKEGQYYRVKKESEKKCRTFNNLLPNNPIIELTKDGEALLYVIMEEKTKKRLGWCAMCFKATDLEEYVEDKKTELVFSGDIKINVSSVSFPPDDTITIEELKARIRRDRAALKARQKHFKT